MKDLNNYKEELEEYLISIIPDKNPRKLYEPIKYILENGGKRIRALLVLLSVESFGKNKKEAFAGASSIEIFHNFTLLHDDIMDQAKLRRGKLTVHEKWDENTAILSGDTMLILAYKLLEDYEGAIYKKLNSLLNKTAIEVCEGQQMDMDFETASIIKVEDYLEMIRLKTAVLLGAALQFGGIIAQANDKDLESIYRFGENLGIAFQIQDDYLDSFGDPEKFGKRVGGDILDGKKTILFIESLKTANDKEKQKLLQLFSIPNKTEDIIPQVLDIYKNTGAPERVKALSEIYTSNAIKSLEKTSIPNEYKNIFKKFAYHLMNRNN